MTDAIRTDDLPHDSTAADSEMLDLPVFDELLAPLRKSVRTKTVRTASRETGDAFDRAFAALEEALRDRDVALSKPMPVAKANPPIAFPAAPAPEAELTPAPELKIDGFPAMLKRAPVATSAPAPAWETETLKAPTAFFMPKVAEARIVEPAIMPTGHFSAPSSSFVQPAFERIEANAPIVEPKVDFERVDAILSQMQQAAVDVMQAMVPALTTATVAAPETIVFEDVVQTSKAEQMDEHELMPFGMASLRMLVM